jgi:hypothetical protein
MQAVISQAMFTHSLQIAPVVVAAAAIWVVDV